MFTFYLFLSSFVGLLFFYTSSVVGFGDLADTLVGKLWAGDYISGLSFAAVAGVLWAFHWRLLHRSDQQGSQFLHDLKMFHLFFAVSILALGLLVHGGVGLSGLLKLDTRDAIAGGLNLVFTLALWVYHFRVFRQESHFSVSKRKTAAKLA